jgi:hypothetical protein
VRWVSVREAQARAGPGLVIEGDYEDVTRPRNDPPNRSLDDGPDKIVHRRD